MCVCVILYTCKVGYNMTLINIRNKLKKENNDYVIFMKFGNFYRVFDDDTYIIWFYTYIPT